MLLTQEQITEGWFLTKEKWILEYSSNNTINDFSNALWNFYTDIVSSPVVIYNNYLSLLQECRENVEEQVSTKLNWSHNVP